MFKFGILMLLFVYFNLNEAINSYIYLPDKYVLEEIPIGSLIVDISEELVKYNELNKLQNVEKTSPDSSMDTSENQHFTFLNDVKSSTENTYFLLDSITGRATSKRYLDRESMCMNKHCMDTCDLGNQNNFVITNSSHLSLNKNSNSKKLDKNPPGNCKLNLKVLIIPSYSIVSLNVILQDINDNKPQFRVEFLNQSIPENVPIGYKIPIDLAYDPDIGINSIQTYTLIQSESVNADVRRNANGNTFKLVQEESQLALIVQQKLDREKVSQYNLTITACDGGGTQSNCGNLKLLLNLVDINDHNPVFMKEAYTFSVMENMPKGTPIGQISAQDLDADLNGKIKYRLIGMSNSAVSAKKTDAAAKILMPPQQQSYFHLDEDTGILSLNAPLDFESEQYFSLNVEARDCGVGSLPAYATIEINVIDTNDNPPEISVSFLNSFYRNYSSNLVQQNQNGNVSMLNLFMNENTESNKFIAHVNIFDRDSAENGQLDWQVFVNEKVILINEPTKENQLLSINKLNSNSFTISTGIKSDVLFDREIMSSINVSIQSIDHGTVPKTNMAFYNFSIVLLDINDNAPVFENSIYDDLSINENNQLNQFIYKFSAIDLDANENARITYSIDFGLNEKFVYIESNTGILRASKVFDREEKDEYEFYVIANDNCEQIEMRKISKVKCILRINDVNDNKPQIFYNSSALPFREYSNRTSLILRLDENLPIQTQLVKFHCDDADINENGKTKFILLNTNFHITSSSVGNNFNTVGDWPNSATTNTNDLLPFKLTKDGRFHVSKKLDREQQDFYDLMIVCYDSNLKEENRLNSSLNLIIRLSDINDNCPRALNKSELINGPTSNIKYLNRDLIDHNENDLFVIYYTDADIGKNAELNFFIDSHADIFELSVAEPLNNGIASSFSNQIYALRIRFKNFTSSINLGKYVIKVRISDNGNPSCIKKDTFILYLGNNETKTKVELVEKLGTVFRQRSENLNGFDTILDYINDEYDEDNSDANNLRTSTLKYSNKTPLMIVNSRPGILHKLNRLLNFTKNDYFIAICLLIFFGILFLLVSIIGFLFMCKNYRRNRMKISKKKTLDALKVKNYRELELMNSSNSNSNLSSGNNSGTVETDRDDENQNEINNLLSDSEQHSNHNINNMNRLSTSFKLNDQSLQSTDSTVSNLIFPRDSSTTVSSICHSSNSSQIGENQTAPNIIQSQQQNRLNQKSFNQQNYNQNSSYSNTLKPKMCNDFANLIDNKVGNARILSSQSNLIKINQCPYENNNSNTLKPYNQRQQQPQFYPPPANLKKTNEGKSITYLTSFPQSLNSFNPQQSTTKNNYLTSSAVTPSSSPSTDGSEIILVASSSSPTQSSCSSDADYFHHHHPQQIQQRTKIYQQQPHQISNNLIINDKNNQFNQSFYQNDRIIAKFSNIRQYVDVTCNDDQDQIDDHEDNQEKMACLYHSSSNGINGNSTLTKNKNRNHFLRSSAV